MIPRLRENCSKMCSIYIYIYVQSFVKIRIFELSEFPCYKLIFEYFYELLYAYTYIYNYFDFVFRHGIVFFVILFYFQLLSRKIKNVCMKSYVESECKSRGLRLGIL